jgi:hypothetical protein
MKKGFRKGRCPLHTKEEGALHIQLKCLETKEKNLRVQLLSRKWIIVNEEVAYNRIINCTNATDVKNTET